MSPTTVRFAAWRWAEQRRFLRRVGKAIGREIDFGRIEAICAHFGRGEELPDGFVAGAGGTSRAAPERV